MNKFSDEMQYQGSTGGCMLSEDHLKNTYLLKGGEKVVSPRQNTNLQEYLEKLCQSNSKSTDLKAFNPSLNSSITHVKLNPQLERQHDKQ